MPKTPDLKPLLDLRRRALTTLLARCDGAGLPDHPDASTPTLFATALGLPQLRSVVEPATMRGLVDRLLEHGGPGGWFTGREGRDAAVSTTAAAAVALYEHRLADRTPNLEVREAWERTGKRLLSLVTTNAPGRAIAAMERTLVFRAVAEYVGTARPDPGPDRLIALADALLPEEASGASVESRLWRAAGLLALFHQLGHADVLAGVTDTVHAVASTLSAKDAPVEALALLAVTGAQVGAIAAAAPAVGELTRRFDSDGRLAPMPPPDPSHTAMRDTLLACDAWFRFAQAASGQLQVPIWRWEDPASRSPRAGSPLRVHALTREPLTNACPYLRLDAPLSHLGAGQDIAYRVGTELSPRYVMLSGRAVDEADVLVLQRFFPTGLVGKATQTRIERSDAAILYDLDDDVFAIPDGHPAFESIAPLLTDLRRILHVADVVTTPSEPLAAALRAQGAHDVRVIPNAIHPPDWPSADPAMRPPSEGPLRLLLAGTASHEADYAAIEPALLRVLERHAGRVTLHVWGASPAGLRGHPGVHVDDAYEWTYRRYAARLCEAAVDLALVPLEANAYNDAKSAIKWLEFSAAGIPGVYADRPPYASVVRDGVDGCVASPAAFEDAIERLLASPEERRALASAAWRLVRAEHTIVHTAPAWREAIRAAHANRAARASRVRLGPTPNPVPIPRHELLGIR